MDKKNKLENKSLNDFNGMIENQQAIINAQKSEIFRLKSIIDKLPGSVYWKDKEGVYQGCNHFVVEMSGMKSAADLIGKTDFDMPWKDYADTLRAIDGSIMETNISQELEEQPVLANGQQVTMLTNKVPLRDEQDRVVGIIGVSVDITNRKKMEIALKEAKEKAEIAHQTKDAFIRNMEHDIRTPVAGIMGISKCLTALETDVSKKAFLVDIENASQELMYYFNDILEFSRLESGEVPVLFIKFDLKDLINSIFLMELPAAKNKLLELIVDYPSDMPSIFIGDKFRIQRILINLVSNAIKFTHQGYVKLSVASVKQKDERNIVVKIGIEDTGIGLTKEKQNILYEKFNRGEPANKSPHKGPGLGLRIVKQFINELEGEIEVNSELGKGTCFTCVLPLRLPLCE